MLRDDETSEAGARELRETDVRMVVAVVGRSRVQVKYAAPVEKRALRMTVRAHSVP